jgi:hypothetical protein
MFFSANSDELTMLYSTFIIRSVEALFLSRKQILPAISLLSLRKKNRSLRRGHCSWCSYDQAHQLQYLKIFLKRRVLRVRVWRRSTRVVEVGGRMLVGVSLDSLYSVSK